MSVIGVQDLLNAPEVQIWNNAAFDNGESEDSTAIKASWLDNTGDCVNQSLESDCSKENLSPGMTKQHTAPSTLCSPMPIKPLHPSNIPFKSRGKPLKTSFEAPATKSRTAGKGKEGEEVKRNIDAEIEEIEKEISRLSAKLEALRLEKAEETARSIAFRGRIVPAKFMEQKQSSKNQELEKRARDFSFSTAKAKMDRRGVSLGPAEIYAASQSRQMKMLTPVQSIQNRRKSCFWKLQDINEEKEVKETGQRRLSLSVSPKFRKAATTVGSKKPVKKQGNILSTVQPKKLFREAEKSAPAKKPTKPGRFVASRYSQINNNQNDARKRSLPDNGRDKNSGRVEKRRASQENETSQKSEGRVKKRWQIPTEIVVFNSELEDEHPSEMRRTELPKIRTLQRIPESPRNSGPAKRVAELEGRRPYFSQDDEGADEFGEVCQTLDFAVEVEEE